MDPMSDKLKKEKEAATLDIQPPIRRLTLRDYVESSAWIIAGSYAVYHSDLINHTLCFPFNPSLNLPFFYLALAALAVFSIAFLFLQYFLTFKLEKRMPAQQLQVYAPVAIPVAAFSGFAAVIAFIIAYWPIFGLMTLVYFFFILMGSMAFLSLF